MANKSWVSSQVKEKEKTTKIAQTAKGQIEYKVYGNAPYMVLLSGSPNPVHLTLGMEDQYPGFGLIVVSRPGYCNTPLNDCDTFEKQADLIVALLDYLKVDKFVVQGNSTGGNPALQIAIRYP